MSKQTGYRESRAWLDCSAHRQQVTGFLVSLARDRMPTLCVWGAGPCNDLDLTHLLNHYSEITLLDLDQETLQNAVAQRGLTDDSRVRWQGGLDLTGIHEMLEVDRTGDATFADEVMQAASQFKLDQLGQFDVVISTCLLSQILMPVSERFGPDAERMDTSEGDNTLVELLSVIRRRHLELLVATTGPSGQAVLVTDVTSSDALPALGEPGADVKRLLTTDVFQGNHFHGLHPRAIDGELTHNEFIKTRVKQHLVSDPWIWNASIRQYLCLAFLMQLRDQDVLLTQ